MKRRDFLRYSLAATGAFGLNLYSIPSFALDNRREKLIYIFLRGGADVLSLFPPKLAQTCSLGAVYDGRHPLYNLRGTLTTNMANSFLFGSAGCQFGDYRDNEAVRPLEIAGYPVHFHPGFKDLEPALNAKKLALFLHTGSLHSSRSHFDQQDFIESGSRWYRYGTGYLARAGSFLPGREPIAIGGAAPRSLYGADVALLSSPDDVKGPRSVAGRARAAHYDANDTLLHGTNLTERLEYFRFSDVNCESVKMCKLATDAQSVYRQLEEDLREYSSTATSDFGKACSLAARLTNAESNPAIMTIDFPGWDHHNAQRPKDPTSGFYKMVQTLAQGLNVLYNEMSQDTVVVVMSEFGRTAAANLSLGTDHGRGGAMMVMGNRISQSRISTRATPWDLAQFDGTNGSQALRVNIDYREIMAELLERHLQIPWRTPSPLTEKTVNKVFDDLASYTNRQIIA